MNTEAKGSAGTLYIVGTPIGNLDDLSARAIDVLKKVNAIAAEDTRRTAGLLSRIGAKAPLIAHHDHNEREETARLLDRVAAGENVALVSDAGMPTISDPGWYLVAQAQERALRVVSVPGPSAVTAALSIAGLPTDRFVFEGFLPRRAAARRARLEELALEARTLVFFESVHRLADSLAAMALAFGGARAAVVVRELTKLHESCYRGSLAELAARLDDEIPLLGEFVVLVGGAPTPPTPEAAEAERIYRLLEHSVPPREAVALTAAITGLSRNEVYRRTRARS
jgi:16S rRNA (cytidine1402-2'-O)-methyltransferase